MVFLPVFCEGNPIKCFNFVENFLAHKYIALFNNKVVDYCPD